MRGSDGEALPQSNGIKGLGGLPTGGEACVGAFLLLPRVLSGVLHAAAIRQTLVLCWQPHLVKDGAFQERRLF